MPFAFSPFRLRDAPSRLQRPQDRPKTAQEAANKVQECSESPNDRSKTPKMAPRRPNTPSRRPKRAPRAFSKGHQEAKTSNPTSPLGRRWSRAFPFPTSLVSLFGRFTSPSPPPWVWTGSPARCQRVLFGPRWLQEGLRERKMASKMAQDSSRWLKIASDTHPRGLETAPRRIQVPFEPSTAPSKMPKSFKSLGKINVLVILAFSLPMGFGILKMAPSWPKRAPRGAQEGPRRPQERPRTLQERPKRAPRRHL